MPAWFQLLHDVRAELRVLRYDDRMLELRPRGRVVLLTTGVLALGSSPPWVPPLAQRTTLARDGTPSESAGCEPGRSQVLKQGRLSGIGAALAASRLRLDSEAPSMVNSGVPGTRGRFAIPEKLP